MDVESPSTELSKLGAEALRDLYNNLAGVKAFALEQAPDVCQQMIYWQITKGAMLLALLIVVLVFFGVVAWRCCKNQESEAVAIAATIGGLFCAVLIPLSFFECSSAIQAIVAPKLFLLEKIAAMLKGLS